jgi:galactarate dehydratase
VYLNLMGREFTNKIMETLLLDAEDNVEVILSSEYSQFMIGSKIARKFISKGSKIIKLGAIIGIASKDISKGLLVDHNVMKELKTPLVARKNVKNLTIPDIPPELLHFEGYLNADNSAGTRNYLCITASVHCVSGVLEHAVKRIRSELLSHYPNVDGVVLLNHTYGCGVAIDAYESHIPRDTLSNIMLNPNFGNYALLIGLGCEKLTHKMMLGSIVDDKGFEYLKYDSLYIQSVEKNGFGNIITAICDKAQEMLEILNKRHRQKLPISMLTVGMQCGGSDAFSGISANPVLGRMSDILIAAGGSTIFSENTECMDAESYLYERCENKDVSSALNKEFSWYREYLARGGADRTANTTPGNKAGGLSSISEKSLGSIAKSGTSQIVDIIPPGGRLKKPGLNYLSGPASDFICGTLQLAASANMHVFTTGRGSPYSIDGFPVLKISSNTDLYKKWLDIIDFDAGKVVFGQDINECAIDLLELIIKTASGTKTAAENLGISNDIVLFNPAPIT